MDKPVASPKAEPPNPITPIIAVDAGVYCIAESPIAIQELVVVAVLKAARPIAVL